MPDGPYCGCDCSCGEVSDDFGLCFCIENECRCTTEEAHAQ